MRAIGQLPDETSAKLFGDYLVVEGVPNNIESGDHGLWAVWVHEDDQLARALELLEEFRRNPVDPKYRRVAPTARELREKEEQAQEAWSKRVHDRSTITRTWSGHVGWLTATLAALCVAVAAAKYLQGEDNPIVRSLYITELLRDGDAYRYVRGLPEIHHGQLWRLITPIFLHFGLGHILFNMLWLLDLGGKIEAREGAGRLAIMIGVMAAVSNLGQYGWAGPDFGGMSGVVYGLFGYVWLRGKFDPHYGLVLDPVSVVLMMVWFFACMTGFVGPIANVAHAGGLGVGLLWGYLAARLNQDS